MCKREKISPSLPVLYILLDDFLYLNEIYSLVFVLYNRHHFFFFLFLSAEGGTR